MNKIRIATVKATGKRYVVKQIQFGATERVNLWGECVSHRGGSAKFETGQWLDLSEVDVVEVDRTPELLSALVAQRIAGLRDKGHVVTMSRTGRTYTDHGTEAQIAARRELARDFNAFLDGVLGKAVR